MAERASLNSDKEMGRVAWLYAGGVPIPSLVPAEYTTIRRTSTAVVGWVHCLGLKVAIQKQEPVIRNKLECSWRSAAAGEF